MIAIYGHWTILAASFSTSDAIPPVVDVALARNPTAGIMLISCPRLGLGLPLLSVSLVKRW